MSDQPESYTCPHCGAVSHHPEDIRQEYCGRCHRWAVDVRGQTREGHLQWAKTRALEYLPNWQEAMNSFTSDLGKYHETAGHPVIELMSMEAWAGLLDEPECRHLIENAE